jgi:hypothetical protein
VLDNRIHSVEMARVRVVLDRMNAPLGQQHSLAMFGQVMRKLEHQQRRRRRLGQLARALSALMAGVIGAGVLRLLAP